MTEKERIGSLSIAILFVILAIVLFFTMERSETSNTWDNNPLVNEMPNRIHPDSQ
jgi:hypothetical protein